MNIKHLKISLLSQLDEVALRGLQSSSNVYVQHISENLAHEATEIIANGQLSHDEKEQQLEFLSDDLNSAEEARELGQELAIIGLAKTIEIRMKKIAKVTELFNEREIRNFFITANLTTSLQGQGITLSSIGNYNAFIELKALNNCLKHSGYVDQNLVTANSSWQLDQPISTEEVTASFNRLLEPSIDFLAAFANEMKQKV